MPSNFRTVKKSAGAYIIHFVGLKLGTHTYDFDVDKLFFEDIEDSLVEDGTVHIRLSLEKKETMMIGTFTVNGRVFAPCDRCNDPMEVAVEGHFRIIYKFGTEISDDENLIVLDTEAYELNVAPQLYEFICVSLPSRILHAPGDCNEEMMELYKSYTINAGASDEEEEEDDWDDGEWDDDDDWEDDDDPDDNDFDDPDDDRPVDPRWAALKNMN